MDFAIRPAADDAFAREVMGAQLRHGRSGAELECLQRVEIPNHGGGSTWWDNGVMLHRRDRTESKPRRVHKRTTIALPADRHIVPSGRPCAV